uniref:Metalloendopeptidase n=1 Tax=Oncorhynchus kisutch TaxID=8019 RepID=A0A8C7FCY2_ONCKI
MCHSSSTFGARSYLMDPMFFLTEKVVEEDTSAELSVGELLTRANRDLSKLVHCSRNNPTSDATLSLLVVVHLISTTASREVAIILRGLDSFAETTCIRFFQRQNERDYLSIESRSGCYSYVGRQGNAQTVSLARQGCLYHSTVQHELLHALGFNHEQTRSDRDNHIHVYWENIIDDMKYNFDKIATLNQGTPYDYNSVMQYERTAMYAFSKNNRPTMEPIPDNNVSFGEATQMSMNDIDRLNRLYGCCEYCHTEQLTVLVFG